MIAGRRKFGGRGGRASRLIHEDAVARFAAKIKEHPDVKPRRWLSAATALVLRMTFEKAARRAKAWVCFRVSNVELHGTHPVRDAKTTG